MKTKPPVQFIMDWNHFSQDREEMLTGELPPDCPTDHAAAIASVVHALCDRDGYALPVPGESEGRQGDNAFYPSCCSPRRNEVIPQYAQVLDL